MVGFLSALPSHDGQYFAAVVNDGLDVIHRMTSTEMEAFRASIDRIEYLGAGDIPGTKVVEGPAAFDFVEANLFRLDEYPGIEPGTTSLDGNVEGDLAYEVRTWYHHCPYTGQKWWCQRTRMVSGPCG